MESKQTVEITQEQLDALMGMAKKLEKLEEQKNEQPRFDGYYIYGMAYDEDRVKALEDEGPLLMDAAPYASSRVLDVMCLSMYKDAKRNGIPQGTTLTGLPWIKHKRNGAVSDFLAGDFFYDVLVEHCHACKIAGMPSLWDGRRWVPGWLGFDKTVTRFERNLGESHKKAIQKLANQELMDYTDNNPQYIQFYDRMVDIERVSISDDEDLLEATLTFEDGAISDEPDPDLHITNVLPHTLNTDAHSDAIDTMLRKISDGDIGISNRIIESWGSCIYRQAIADIIVYQGPGGNGKGTVTGIIAAMLGRDNCSSVPIGKLDTPDAIDMLGKLANIDADVEAGFARAAQTAFMRKMSGNDSVTFSQKYKDAITWDDPYCTQIICANDMFSMSSGDATSVGMERRLKFVPFLHKFDTATEKDPDLDVNFKRKVTGDPEAMQYVCLLALKGLLRLISNDLHYTECKSADDMLEEYKRDNNSVLQWIYENDIKAEHFVDYGIRIKHDGNATPYYMEPYVHYEQWCGRSRKAVSSNRFGREVKKHFNLERDDKPHYSERFGKTILGYRRPGVVEGGGTDVDG